jgi:predicted transcriptional regulator
LKGQTLRLNHAAWRQLKTLALEREQPAHVLLVEAVNDLFRKYEKAAIA